MKAQGTLINEFVKGATKGGASHMSVDGDTLFSYGSHFPLLVRMDWGFLLNADKYSSTTSSHQSSCFKHATIQIPFSALRSAGIPHRAIELVDHDAQRYDVIGYTDYEKNISVAEYNALTETEKEGFSERTERRPEAAIIKYDGKHYLSSMDGWNFFLCQLPEPVETVAEAFASLKPTEVKDENFIRQGEWFFVEATELPIVMLTDGVPTAWDKMKKFFYKTLTKGFTLPNKNPDGNLHIATRGVQLGDGIYVSGQVRHQTRWGGRGDHRMLRLSTLEDIKIFQAFENRALGSWSASGNVD
uniref:Uncharacterized protein n=1 Tax=viral metagenome TaxID=1070528 RepID=A0A6M3L0S9_9ZZZZ